MKDILVDLNTTPFYPEFPKMPRKIKEGPPKKKKTKSNVWRKWREDSEQDVVLAVRADMVEQSFQPQLFLKNEDDIEKCKTIIE